MPRIDLSKFTKEELNEVKESVLRDLLKEASKRENSDATAAYDRHSSSHSKS